jgi:hypothetical protein
MNIILLERLKSCSEEKSVRMKNKDNCQKIVLKGHICDPHSIAAALRLPPALKNPALLRWQTDAYPA